MGLRIPWTVYDRKRGDQINDVSGSKVRNGVYLFIFGGDWLPLPNIFGDDHVAYFDQVVISFGYSILLKKAVHNPKDNSITVEIDLLSSPDEPGGPLSAAIPLVAIVGGIAAIVGGILLVTALTKVEHIFELPVFYLVAGAALLATIGPAVKSIRGGGS